MGMQLDSTRYRAKDLDAALLKNGRRQDWLALQIGVSKSQMSYIVNGKRTVSEPVGRQIAAIIGVPFGMYFELSTERDLASVDIREAAVA